MRSSEKRPVIVSFQGRLGNKLFQYALAIHLEAEGHRVEYETAACALGSHERPFQLERVFRRKFPGIPFSFAVYRLAEALNKYGLYRLYLSLFADSFEEAQALEFDPRLAPLLAQSALRPLLIRGYFQNPSYFHTSRQTILERIHFDPPVTETGRKLVERIASSASSVAVHVRRGDYVGLGITLGTPYYQAAIREIRNRIPNPRFFFFSDDPNGILPLCSDLGLGQDEFEIVRTEGEAEWVDLGLMSQARGLIMANSSYSWWAGYLNLSEDSVVCGPAEWWSNQPVGGLFLDRWISVSRSGGIPSDEESSRE